MTGLFLFIVVGIWVCFCVTVVRMLLHRWPTRPWRLLVLFAVFLALLIVPVIDEIIGGFQFRALCEKNAVLRLGVVTTEGRRTKYASNPLNEIVAGTAVPIYRTGSEYVDVDSGELVLKFDEYVAKGGVLIRALGISESNSPLTIGKHACSPEDIRGEAINRTLKFSVVN